MENKKETMTTEERLNSIISSVKELRMDYTDANGDIHHEYTGDYAKSVTEAICNDIDYYSGYLMDEGDTLGHFIATWPTRLCAYSESLEQMANDFKEDRKPTSFDSELRDSLCDDVVSAVNFALYREGEPYTSFLKLCLHVSSRVTYIRLWEYVYEELWLMREATRDVPTDKELSTFMDCRKKLMHLLIMLRCTGDDHDFLINELAESWKTLIKMVKAKKAESQKKQ